MSDAAAPAAPYRRFTRPVPAWYRAAKLGIFVHWGAYSVPAWAEPTGELGTVDPAIWFRHNPYAEWYWNTIRIDSSPAQQHHRDTYAGAPYDDFLDRWRAEEFDADALIAAFVRAGARYVVPTTKHHDGIPLWPAPGTDGRDTVGRGPRRDLVGDLAAAARRAGLRFGVYYSGGLDWHASRFPPITDGDFEARRPKDAGYAAYANGHVLDLVRRYAPDVLWGDIEWPDAGKPEGPLCFAHVLDAFYAAAPDGVVNDRFGATHADFRTSEYQHGRDVEGRVGQWEHCRGIGLSFGYNAEETAVTHLDGPGAVRLLVDVVSRGGNLLLNVGPTAAGTVPPLQQRCLDGLADWMAGAAPAVHDTEPVDPRLGRPGEAPWIRWTRTGDTLHAVVDASGTVELDADADRLNLGSARGVDGSPVPARSVAGRPVLRLPPSSAAGPLVVDIDLAG